MGFLGTAGTIRKIFHPFRIKMLAVPGVLVLKCHPYRRIPIVIHGIRLRHHLFVITLTVRSSLLSFAPRARGCVSM